MNDPEWVDKLTYIYRSAALTEKQKALCDYAYFATAYPGEISTDQVDKLRTVGFKDHEILESAFCLYYYLLTCTVELITFMPELANFSKARFAIAGKSILAALTGLMQSSRI